MYDPKPINIEDIDLSEEVMEAVETIAKNVHETWAAERIAEGWTLGEKRDDTEKKTPCLVEYEELPEFEKDYDRNTALTTIKTLLKLGFKIEKSD